MARVKERELGVEERLEQALVPEDEQPYEVPGNWVWARLKDILDVRDGTHDTPKYMEKGIPLITSKNLIGNNLDFSDVKYISTEDHNKISERSGVSDGDILMAMIGTIGNPVVVQKSQDFSIKNVALFKPLSCAKIKPKFICYFLKSSEEYMREHASGGLQPFVSLTYLRNFPISLPPLAEQQRIVNRIESLFAKLDQARELAQNALDTFETRKAAILHKAFTGELTARWREKNGVGMESWENKPLSDLSYIQTGLAKGKKNTQKVVMMPYLRVANVQDGYLDLKEIKQIEVEEDKVKRYTLQRSDVLFTEGGDFDKLGRGAVWEGEIAGCLHQNHIFAVRPNPLKLSSYYLTYLSGSQYGKDYFLSCSKQTTNLASINSTQLKAFPVITPTLLEQQEIVRILDNLFEKEQKAKELCDVIDKIDLMKKAILARAFRGELGTNDPSEESAVELLKECLK